ncbi:MAG TPA: hypothetical protein VET65_02630 [Candidatus Limnocylindrales bacterium]|nr:hypothetical protein [Candidatus Limnocylindrales bacterium]
MLTLITAWISERIITVTTVAVVAVAAVPTTLVIVNHGQTTVTVSQQEHQQQVTLVAAVKKVGDAAITKLTTAEQGCTVQLNQTIANAHLAPGQIQPQLTQAKTQLHGAVAPLIAAIQKHEDDFSHLKTVTKDEEQNEEHEISLIVLTGLGQGHTPGTITVSCQTVTIEIQTVIQVIVLEQQVKVVQAPAGKGDRDGD